MRIDCPSCAAAYEVPDSVLAAGRMMRCARCGTEFRPAAPEALPPLAAPLPRPEPVRIAAAPDPAPPEIATPDDRLGLRVSARHDVPVAPRRAAVLAAWLLSFALLGAGAWAAIAWRAPVMRAWPASARLYAALGYAR